MSLEKPKDFETQQNWQNWQNWNKSRLAFPLDSQKFYRISAVIVDIVLCHLKSYPRKNPVKKEKSIYLSSPLAAWFSRTAHPWLWIHQHSKLRSLTQQPNRHEAPIPTKMILLEWRDPFLTRPRSTPSDPTVLPRLCRIGRTRIRRAPHAAVKNPLRIPTAESSCGCNSDWIRCVSNVPQNLHYPTKFSPIMKNQFEWDLNNPRIWLSLPTKLWMNLNQMN